MLGLVFCQAINLGVHELFIERYGPVKGPVLFALLFPILYFFFVSFIPMHAYKICTEGLTLRSQYTQTARGEGASRPAFNLPFQTFRFGISLGTLLIWLIIFSPYQPVSIAANIFMLHMPVAWVFGPFLMNGSRNGAEKLLLGIFEGTCAFGLATVLLPVDIGKFIIGSLKLLFNSPNHDFLNTHLPHSGTMGMPGINDCLADPATEHTLIGTGTRFDARFLQATRAALDFLKAQGKTIDEGLQATLAIDLVNPKARSPPGFLGLLYVTPLLWQYLHAGRKGKDGQTPTVYLAQRLIEYIMSTCEAKAQDYVVAFIIHEVAHLLGLTHQEAARLHQAYLTQKGYAPTELEELLTGLTHTYSQGAALGYQQTLAPIIDLQNFYQANLQEGLTQEVACIFDRGAKGKLKVSLAVPADASLTEEAVVHTAKIISGLLPSIGTQRLLVYYEGIQEHPELFEGIKAKINFDPVADAKAWDNRATDPQAFYKLPMRVVYRANNKVSVQINVATQEEVVQAPTSLPVKATSQQVNLKEGLTIGVDVGGNARKSMTVHNGVRIFEPKPTPWKPHTFTKGVTFIEELSKEIQQNIDELARIGIPLSEVKGIGISWAAVVENNRIAARAKLEEGLGQDAPTPEERTKQGRAEFDAWIAPLAEHIQKRFFADRREQCAFVINDGAAQSFGISKERELSDLMIFGLGTSVAVGFVDANGNNADILKEFSLVIMDASSGAYKHHVTFTPGALPPYIASGAIDILAKQHGLDLMNQGPQQHMRYLEHRGNETYKGHAYTDEEHAKAVLICEQLGRNLAVAIATLAPYFTIRNAFITGGVARGIRAKLVIAAARKVLAEEYP